MPACLARVGLPILSALAILVSVNMASAQPVGTFRWQLSPYCNTLTLLVEQKAGRYELTGTDDQCGAPVAASARGTAHFNPDGSVGIGLTVVRPDGITVGSSARISLATLSGTWRDDFGNSGTFQYSPPSPAPGSPRSVTLRGDYTIMFAAAEAAETQAAAFSFGRTLPAPASITPADVIPVGGPATARCPGTASVPLAAPGVLCLYERIHINISTMGVRIENNAIWASDAFGAFVYARAADAGTAIAAGTWAVSVP